MTARKKITRRFWTPYRQFYIETQLARGTSRKVIAEHLGCSYGALNTAIYRLSLRAKPLLPEVRYG